MFNVGTKSLFALGVAAMVAALVYGIATDEASGATVLGFVAGAAIALAAVAISAGPDRAPVPAEGALLHNTPAGGRSMFPTVWPLAGGVAVALFAIGAATNKLVVVPAIVIAAVVLAGWVFQAWTEHPVFTARFGARLSDRLLVPVGLPVAVFALVLVIALSISRVLLAVSKHGSVVVALVVAVVILFSAFFVASQERMGAAAMKVLCAVALVAVVAAGVAGLAHGERKFERKGGVAAGGATATTEPTTTTSAPSSPTTTAGVTAGFATTPVTAGP